MFFFRTYTLPVYSLLVVPIIGNYTCFKGNNPDICDQKIERIYGPTESPTALTMSYVGYCGDQGPFTYYCENGVCSDGRIRITFLDEKSYFWENLSYSFACEMRKI